MENARNSRARWIAAMSAALLVVSFLMLWAVLRSDALTANLMDGAYPTVAHATSTRILTVASVALTILGFAGLGWAATVRGPAWWVTLLACLGAIALVLYGFVAVFVLAVAFG